MNVIAHAFFRLLSLLLVASTLAFAATPLQAAKLPKLILSGPSAAVSFPFAHMIQSGALAEIADEVEFVLWSNPDQLRLMAIEGKADVMALPTNVAANLYNRKVALQLVNVSTWGILWLISRNPEVKTLQDLKGEEIAIPFRADMPDIVFSTVATAQGLSPQTDFKLRYVASPMDAMQLLMSRRIDHALLAEPAVSMVLRKTQSFPTSIIAPELHRGVDMQAEWGRVLQRSTKIPQAGIAVMGELRNNAEIIDQVMHAYRNSLKWCQAQPLACGEMVAPYMPMLKAEAISDAIAISPLEAIAIEDAREELQFFFDTLMKGNPATIGGHLPDDAFYVRPLK